MVSKQEKLALEAVRHFKEAQLAAWLGDKLIASEEFQKCRDAVAGLEEQAGVRGFHELAKLAEVAPRKKDDRISDIQKAWFSTKDGDIVPITYTLIPQGSNRAEFRARIYWHWRHLSNTVHKIQHNGKFPLVVNERALQWIEANRKIGFSGIFLLTYSDGTVYAQITTHQFVDRISLDKLREEIMPLVMSKLALVRTPA